MQFQPSELSYPLYNAIAVRDDDGAEEASTNGAFSTLGNLAQNYGTGAVFAASFGTSVVGLSVLFNVLRPLGGFGNFKRAAKWSAGIAALSAGVAYHTMNELGEAASQAVEGDF